jgi:hypothetical protein
MTVSGTMAGGDGPRPRFALERRLVFHAVVAGKPAHKFAFHPVPQDAAQVLARHPGQRGEVTLAHFLADQDAAFPDILAERIGENQQGACGEALDGQEACRHQRAVDVAQAARQHGGDRAEDLGMNAPKLVENGAADELQL